jgi:hypothetical protein
MIDSEIRPALIFLGGMWTIGGTLWYLMSDEYEGPSRNYNEQLTESYPQYMLRVMCMGPIAVLITIGVIFYDSFKITKK